MSVHNGEPFIDADNPYAKVHLAREQTEDNKMSTPIEDAVLARYLGDLIDRGLSEDLVKGVGAAFLAEKLPTAETMAELIKLHSGDKIA